LSANARSGGEALTQNNLLLDARDLHAWYGSSHFLHGIDLQMKAGQTLSLLGHNGMCKSTLIRTLLGVEPNISPII
jgi:branched-chain amino acid transport system ATP-binding protein